MSFHRKRIVKKPRKAYKCELCGKSMQEHIYHSVLVEGQFQTMRTHACCWAKLEDKCKNCTECTLSAKECYHEG